MHYLEEDIGHDFSTGSMVTAVKQIMEDVGIVSAVADFNADEDDYEAFGTWEEFD